MKKVKKYITIIKKIVTDVNPYALFCLKMPKVLVGTEFAVYYSNDIVIMAKERLIWNGKICPEGPIMKNMKG